MCVCPACVRVLCVPMDFLSLSPKITDEDTKRRRLVVERVVAQTRATAPWYAEQQQQHTTKPSSTTELVDPRWDAVETTVSDCGRCDQKYCPNCDRGVCGR